MPVYRHAGILTARPERREKKLPGRLFCDGLDSDFGSKRSPMIDTASDERDSSLTRDSHRSHSEDRSRLETFTEDNLSIDPFGSFRCQYAGLPAGIHLKSVPLCRHTQRMGIVSLPAGRHSRLSVGMS